MSSDSYYLFFINYLVMDIYNLFLINDLAIGCILHSLAEIYKRSKVSGKPFTLALFAGFCAFF